MDVFLWAQTPSVNVELQRVVANEIVVVSVLVQTQLKLRVKQLLHLQKLSSSLSVKHRPHLQHMNVKHNVTYQLLGFFLGLALSKFVIASGDIEVKGTSILRIVVVKHSERLVIFLYVIAEVVVFLDARNLSLIKRVASLGEVRFRARPHLLNMPNAHL